MLSGSFSRPAATHVEALDHLSTKLRIPLTAVEPTNAQLDDGLVPGVCRLYLEGRCRQGARCFQVHVQRDVLEALRREALETPSCCHRHGAPCNFEGLPFNLAVNIGPTAVGLHSLCPTNCLWGLYSEHGENELNVPKGRVCREHRRGLCRFGEECGFLHICREIPLEGDEYISATPVPIPRVNGRGGIHNNNSATANTMNNGRSSRNSNCDLTAPCGSHSLHLCGSHAEEINHAAQSFNANSFNAASYNNGHYNGTLNAHYGGTNQSSSFLGADSGCGSMGSMARSRQSFSYRMKQMSSEGEGMFRGPLLRPLGAPPAQTSPHYQRHNPYGDASSFQ
ncbi:uncharacterized protein TM35_000191130 [Trypanosoma theileri]|uniref:C3H1-type domain-containing protein n=1 Tax=Trypanosoma theileri TaxID=67003 RepID=A0A1X0NUJ7_9TRYP|nr:uncharacterized protein TM35_000191130 [Trypanosoma theileri]ORC87869.1 hypothetical protein TM35_000191130 [Trypanosoma theileri]